MTSQRFYQVGTMTSQRFYQSRYHDFPRFYQSRNHDFTEVLPELQEERLEAARIAEEVARKAAEEAVRQLEAEHSAKIVIETLPESNEQLPNILEEENEDDPECAPDLCPPKEPDTPSSTAVEPASEKRDLESPVTQQPEPRAPAAPTTTPEEAKAAGAAEGGGGGGEGGGGGGGGGEGGGGGGVPDICSPIMSFLLRFPHAVECLESCRTLMHEHYLTPLKLSTPALPPELTQLREELSQLPTQARHCCMSIIGRFRRLNSNSQHPEQP
ncbi:hypothetical protein D9C73_027913 [Collichthys lucidus]|uniref:Uncharacterized protein n=1 Tax=Collichthys lucidus TaxID=240159 RepID=A0A4U5TUN8_COLLU|nr:hypothetical protein D9C73_027913 [Collichthys lucidus]